jgi:hypothetical protein
MKKIVLLLFIVPAIAFGQDKINIVFNEKKHDFGTIKEEDGIVSTQFTFVNTSSMPITIKEVRASCGCTTPSYSLEPIAPNKEGKVMVSYNPDNRPGNFNKSIIVQLGNDFENRTEKLIIDGVVLPKGAKFENLYPYSIGNLLFREKALNIGSIFKNESRTKTIEMFNNSDKELSLSFAAVPEYLDLESEAEIAPKQKSVLTIVFNAQKSKEWGAISNIVRLKTSDKFEGAFTIKANVVEDFSKITDKQLQVSPVTTLSTRNLNLMSIKAGTTRKSKIQITNSGYSSLIIRNIQPNSDNVSVKISKNEIAPGESAVLDIIVDAKNLELLQYRKQIQIVTNDPINPVTNLNIEWQVE